MFSLMTLAQSHNVLKKCMGDTKVAGVISSEKSDNKAGNRMKFYNEKGKIMHLSLITRVKLVLFST